MDDETAGERQAAEPPRKPVWKIERFAELSRGRLIRLGVLVCVLIALLAFALHVRAKTERERKQLETQVAAAVEEMKAVIRSLVDNSSAEDLAQRLQRGEALFALVKGVDPENVEVEQLAVPLCYAAGRFDESIAFFNRLDAFAVAKEMDPALYTRATEALLAFDMLRPETASPLITSRGKHYIRACGFLWGLAREITAGAEDDTEKAVRLCRWIALHVLPEPPDCLAADPYVVAWRSYGSAEQAAWTYAELARQVGLRVRVVVQAGEAEGTQESCIVQVYPADGDPFLVDPYAGVPLMDVSSGELLSLQHAQDAPASLAALRALPGADGVPSADRLTGAELKTAVSVESCFPCFLVFDYLLRVMPEYPEVSLCSLESPDEEVVLWEVPIAIRERMGSERDGESADRDFRYIDLAQPGRAMQLRGEHLLASRAYAARMVELTEELAGAETEESAAILREGLDFTAFSAASNALDGGAFEAAEARARAYLDQHAEGRWRVLAQLILAEALNARGDEAAAKAIWQQELPAQRRLYGALRARGLLAGSPALVAVPPAPAEASRSGAP